MTNNINKTLDYQEVCFHFSHEITSIRNAKIKSHIGDHCVIENLSLNSKLNAVRFISFVCDSTPGDIKDTITSVQLNGTDDDGVDIESKIDYLNIMTYDMHERFSDRTDENSPLDTPEVNCYVITYSSS